MTSYGRSQTGRECPPPPEKPAEQPHPPDEDKCCDLAEPKIPDVNEPEPCPPSKCKCPTPPVTDLKCCGLDDLIKEQATIVFSAERAVEFKKALEVLLKSAKDAAAKYTRGIYDTLIDQWVKEDACVVELIRKLVCAVPCWRCILDCHVCPLLDSLHITETKLYNDTKYTDNVIDLYDRRHWLIRYTNAKKRQFERITSVMTAWSSPAETISKALTANKSLIDSSFKVIGTEPGKAIYDVFFKIVPMHLAIAPPETSKWTTNIDKRYTEFCECSKGAAEYCCGQNLGKLNLRQRLIGPQPYLIDPDKYFQLICCLVTKRWGPVKKTFDTAESKLKAVETEIANAEAQFKDGWIKSFEAAATGAIPSVINCCEYEHSDDSAQKPARDCEH